MNALTVNGKQLTVDGVEILGYGAPSPVEEVTIGTQTWKTKNLAIDDGHGGIVSRSISYDGNVTFVTEYYYNLAAAQRIANSITGWHLPSLTEVQTLISTIGGSTGGATKLKATYSWGNGYNGTDDYGFRALNAGYNYQTSIWPAVNRLLLWTSTLDPANSTKGYKLQVGTGADIADFNSLSKTDYYLSVRLIKDAV